ncbi:MAG: NAD-dependent epimerase/dehydratase family protein [Acidobacteriota bacterium]
MKILATGGTGFFGRHLVPLLRQAGHAVTAPSSSDADLRRPDALAPWRDERFDAIVHLAAWTRAGTFCRTHGGEQWRVQQTLDRRALDFWADHQRDAVLVSFGTSVAHAPSRDLHREDAYLAGEPSAAYFGYAMAKRSLYAGARSLAAQHGMRSLHLVPSTLYGPDYHLDGRPLHFVYDLARKIARGVRFGEPVVLWGDGAQRRELVFVADAARWVAALLERAAGPRNAAFEALWAQDRAAGVVHLGAGDDASIREIAERLCRLAGLPSERLTFDRDAFVGARAKRLAVDRLDALWPDRPRTSLDDGLAATMAWVDDHLEALG